MKAPGYWHQSVAFANNQLGYTSYHHTASVKGIANACLDLFGMHFNVFFSHVFVCLEVFSKHCMFLCYTFVCLDFFAHVCMFGCFFRICLYVWLFSNILACQPSLCAAGWKERLGLPLLGNDNPSSTSQSFARYENCPLSLASSLQQNFAYRSQDCLYLYSVRRRIVFLSLIRSSGPSMSPL